MSIDELSRCPREKLFDVAKQSFDVASAHNAGITPQ
jgi:hypothetical protein